MGKDETFDVWTLYPLREYLFEGSSFWGPNQAVSFLQQFPVTDSRHTDFLENKSHHDEIRDKYLAGEELPEVDFMTSGLE